MSRKFYIIGAGMGAPDSLTGEAVHALAASDEVFATPSGWPRYVTAL